MDAVRRNREIINILTTEYGYWNSKAFEKIIELLKTKESKKCECTEEKKTGTTTVACCNICGLPDEKAWIL